ncbi:MAG: EamA family transporter [Thermodesulfobacteriota bacterium]
MSNRLMAFGALTWHIIYPPFHYLAAGFSPYQWKWIFDIAIMGTIIPFGLYFIGINYLRSTRALITATLEPISAGFMVFIFLGEDMEPLQILGGAVVLGAVILLQTQPEQDKFAPDLIRAQER